MVVITDEMITAGVNAMHKHESQQAAIKVAAIDLDTDNYLRVFSTALGEGDRAASILIFAYIEECLCKLIERHFDPSIATMDDLTRPNGLLATSSARLTLIAGLRWVQKETFDALNLIRKIRNNFAHHVEIASFDHNVIRGLIASIAPFETPAIAAIIEGGEPRKLRSRELFFMRAAAAVNRLSVEGAVFPVARHHRIGPGDVLRGWDDRPTNVQEMCRATSRIVCQIYQNNAVTPLPIEWLELGGRKAPSPKD